MSTLAAPPVPQDFHLESSNAAVTNAPRDDMPSALQTGVLDLFDRHAQAHPDDIAAEFKGETVSYGRLYNASIQVALVLRARGFRPRDRIPLVTTMGLEMLASVLGILRVGAAYCPIDFNSWSSARVLATLEAVGSPLVLSTVETTLSGYELVQVPGMLTRVPLDPTEELDAIRRQMKSSDLIYIIFTSGTTGKPKGVMVSHGSAVHLAQQDFQGAMRVIPGEKILLFFSVAFDGCAGVIFSTLCHGGTLSMALPSDVISVAAKCTTLVVTPSLLASLEPSPEFDDVRSIYMGGEAPTPALIKAWTSSTRKVYNCYGPTECTTAVSTAEVVPGGPIVLGNVVSGVELVLLDENLKDEVDEGEICIRGPCLAVGYLNNDTLTSQKFFYRHGVRHYRTGDLARRSAHGLHFVARVDRVVKNRGFLINLEAEVEPALCSFPGVERAAAFQWEKKLAAFVTPADVSMQGLRQHLTRCYDSFIIPDLLFSIGEFPLTSNGKVDTKMLQSLAKEKMGKISAGSDTPKAEPSRALTTVLEAFSMAFDRPVSQISPSTSFRGLGGNSLTAVKLMSRLRREHLSVALSQLLELDTPAAIAQATVVLGSDCNDIRPTDGVSPSAAPFTPHQAELFRETAEDGTKNVIFYSLTRETATSGLDARRLRAAWETIVDRHAIYRTVFDLENQTQTINNKIQLDWREFQASDDTELLAISKRERDILWSSLRWQNGRQSIQKPCFFVIEVPGSKLQMNWVVHHAYTDAWSFGILLAELELIIEGRAAELAPAPSFADIAQHLATENQRQSEQITRFWLDYADTWPQLKPVKIPKPEFPSSEPWNTWESDIAVNKSLLDDFAQRNKVSAATVIYTAWALVLSQFTSSKTVGMKVSVSGRNLSHPSADRVVGSLNGRCPLIVQVEGEATIADMMGSLQSTFLRVNDTQWTYPAFRRQISDGQHNNTYWFDSQVVVLLDLPVDPGQWAIFEVQKPTAPIWLGVVQKGSALNVRLRYDGSRYSRSGIELLSERLVKILVQMVGSPDGTYVRDVAGGSL